MRISDWISDVCSSDLTQHPARTTYSAPALEKGLEIIELLAAERRPMSTRAIAERLGRSKGEIFRVVFVLVERGYLRRDAASDELTLSNRSEEHTSELQSLMRISYAVFCLKKKTNITTNKSNRTT